MRSMPFVLAVLLGTAPAAQAGEQTLKFRMILADTEAHVFQATGVKGAEVSAHDAIGLAVFDDGRIAFKKFVYLDDSTEVAGGGSGYSTYTFENGDSLTAKFTYDWSPAGLKGVYDVVSGTGAYAGATGTGSFESVSVPWEGATLEAGSLTIEVPGT
jgi:hypothetical protein